MMPAWGEVKKDTFQLSDTIFHGDKISVDAQDFLHIFLYIRAYVLFFLLVVYVLEALGWGENVMFDTIYPWSEATKQSTCCTQIYSCFSFGLFLSLCLCLSVSRNTVRTTTYHSLSTVPRKWKTTRYINQHIPIKNKK